MNWPALGMALAMALCGSPAMAGYLTLEILHPRAAGTGSPAIPSTHRIFYAYPGVEYKIRVAAVGGDYPYTFTLSNAPAGMTVDPKGYIRWTNPQTSASNITVRVTDSLSAYTEQTWSVAVQDSNFKFVDCTAGTNGTGTLASPYNSIENMVSGADPADIVYFRAGTCDVPYYGGGSFPMSTVGGPVRPHKWLAYPGESPVINFNNNGYIYSYSNASSISMYFEGLRFVNALDYVVFGAGEYQYVTFLDNTFSNINSPATSNNNQGTYYGATSATVGNFLTFHGNTLTDYGGVQGIGSLYNQNKILIEGNTFTDFHDATASINVVIALKEGITNSTLRGNKFDLDDVAGDFMPTGSGTNGALGDGTPSGPSHGGVSQYNEILYNYFRSVSPNDLNRTGTTGTTWIHRNTYVSALQFTWLAPDSCEGPWYVNGNVFQNAASGPSDHGGNTESWGNCVTEAVDNLGATSGLVDSDGKLLSTTYVGTRGWQFADGSTPIDGSPTITHGGRLSGSLSGGGVMR